LSQRVAELLLASMVTNPRLPDVPLMWGTLDDAVRDQATAGIDWWRPSAVDGPLAAWLAVMGKPTKSRAAGEDIHSICTGRWDGAGKFSVAVLKP
jgi:hypothetical protein